MSKRAHFKRFFRSRGTTTQSETTFNSSKTTTHVSSSVGTTEHVRTEQTAVQKAEPQESLSTASTDSQSSAPKHLKRKIASAILKKTITIAANIAQNVAMVPGAQVAGELVIAIIERFDQMNLNDEMAQQLANQVDTLMFIVSEYASKNPDNWVLQRFVQRLREIAQDEGLIPRRKVFEFFNSDEKQGAIDSLNVKLNSAVQVLSTGLQIQTVQKLDAMNIEKFKEVALNDPGAVIKTLKNIHLEIQGNVNVAAQGTGRVEMSLADSHIQAKGGFSSLTTGGSVYEVHQNTRIYSDGDLDLTTIACGSSQGLSEMIDQYAPHRRR